MISRPWWRILAGGKLAGWLRIGRVVVVGVREKSVPVHPAPTRCRLRVPRFLPEGRRCYPSRTPFRVPGGTLGHIRAAASLTSHPFLEVLLGTRRFGALCGGTNLKGPTVVDHSCFVELPLLTFSSSFFLF